MTVYQSSLGDDELEVKDEEDVSPAVAGFLKIGDVMVQPAVDICLSAAEGKKRLRPAWDGDVFVLNCLSYLLVLLLYFPISDSSDDAKCCLQSVLEPFEFTKPQQNVIQEAIDSRVEQLTDEHVSFSFRF